MSSDYRDYSDGVHTWGFEFTEEQWEKFITLQLFIDADGNYIEAPIRIPKEEASKYKNEFKSDIGKFLLHTRGLRNVDCMLPFRPTAKSSAVFKYLDKVYYGFSYSEGPHTQIWTRITYLPQSDIKKLEGGEYCFDLDGNLHRMPTLSPEDYERIEKEYGGMKNKYLSEIYEAVTLEYLMEDRIEKFDDITHKIIEGKHARIFIETTFRIPEKERRTLNEKSIG